uniref:RNA-directed RNA polymerase n=1 Tax=Zea mays chrysovirus 1 TaxID=2382121 RepID=A0A386JUE3_9VIRU|nr:putative RNA-dependent RNA polymerase [Zea mays chrysovirus 1]
MYKNERRISREYRAQLGCTRTSIEHIRFIESSASRYLDRQIPGLYAIIIPSGGGKSTMCSEFGFIDVDDVVGDREVMEGLVMHRREMIRTGERGWKEHNDSWYTMVNDVLRRYNFSEEPNIIMVHSEEFALEIGAEPLVALVPSERLDSQRLRCRNELERILAYDNRELVRRRTHTVRLFEYHGWTELGQFVSAYAWDYLEMAAPFRFFRKKPKNGWPIGYADDVPLWVLQGKPCSGDDINNIERMHKLGMVPDACYSYYTSSLYNITEANVRHVEYSKMWIDICSRVYEAGKMQQVRKEEIKTEDLEKLYPFESEMAKKKRTVGLRKLLENTVWEDSETASEVLLNRRGSNHNLVTSLVIWTVGVLDSMRPEVIQAVLNSGVLLIPDDKWIEIMKTVHDLVRTTGQFFGIPLKPKEVQRLMYLHMLYGRFVYKVDEQPEIEKRLRDLDALKVAYNGVEWTNEEYDRLELAGIRDAYKRLTDTVPDMRVTDFIEFWKKRRTWAAKGSTVVHEGEKYYMVTFMDKVMKKIELRHNKKSLMEDEREGWRIIAGIIDKVGRNDTKLVPKFESAAKRALMPGNLYHYVVFSYVLYTFENCAAVGDVRLGINRDQDFSAFDNKLQRKLASFDYDFADFNAQHSQRSMARVISVLAEVADPCETLTFCLNWLTLSFSKMEIVDREGQVNPIHSGLYSGWRGTTWINSVLNHAYMYVARACYLKLKGTDPFVEYEGAGDDVDAQVRDFAVAGQLYAITIEMGLASNKVKQLFGPKSEFLRVSYEKDYAGASVARGIGNFVSGNWEGEGGSIRDRLVSTMDNVLTLGRRGMNDGMVTGLRACVIDHIGRVFEGDSWRPISPYILHGSVLDGAFGIPDGCGRVWRLKEKAPEPEGWAGLVKLPAMAMSRDWVSVMEEEVMTKGYVIEDKQTLTELLAKDSYDVKGISERLGYDINKEEWDKYWNFKTEVIGYENVETDDYDIEMLHNFLSWLDEGDNSELERLNTLEVLGRYVGMMKKPNGKVPTEEEWYGEYWLAHKKIAGFDTQRWSSVKCPQLVQSKIALWCKEWLICEESLAPVVARYIFLTTCNAYAQVYNFEV